MIDESALLVNGSLIAVGVLNVLAGYGLYRVGRRWSLLVISAVAGLGAAGAGLLPLDRGGLHGLFALAAFVGFNLEAIASARLVHGFMRAISIGSGMVGLAFVVLMVIGDAGNPAAFAPIGHGGVERMIVYPPMLWMLAFGGWLLGRDRMSD